MNKRPITQRDVARELGVSSATVSLGLRNSDQLSRARCLQIQETARRMGYRPNPMATELSHYKKQSTTPPVHATIAWINSWLPSEKLRSYRQFDLYWRGALEAAGKLGYQLEEFRLDGGMNPARLHKILRARGIRGILLPPQHDQIDWAGFPWDDYVVVRMGRSLHDPASHLVSSDHVTNAMLAFDRIRKLGYRRIGLLADEDAHARRGGHLIEAGFLMARQLADENDRVSICAIGKLPEKDLAKHVAEWVRRERVDAVFTEVTACGGILAQGGVEVPGDVGLAGSNVHDIPTPAGIDQHPLEIGRVALLMLHSLTIDRALGIPTIRRQVLVEGSWVDGDTLPPRA